MKTKIAFFLLTIGIVVLSCKKDKEVEDPIYEFVSFIDDSPVNVLESPDPVPVPVVIQLWAFKPKSEDIDLTLEITGHNAVMGTDFTITPSDMVKIRAGSLTSDTIWVTSIDNGVGVDDARTIDIAIASASKADLKIGLGLAAPTKTSVTVVLVDDECTGSPLCIYNTTLNNTIGGSTVNPATVVLDKANSKITVSGDLMDYSTFPGATLTITLTPTNPGDHSGSATFDDPITGTDNDGYVYKFHQTSPGTYDADAGTISIEYDVLYEEGGGWTYWYTTTNVYSVP